PSSRLAARRRIQFSGPTRRLPGPATQRGMTMKLRPLFDRVVVKRLDAEQKTAGGIIIPDSAKEKPMEGLVVAVGPGKRNDAGDLIALDVSEGDKVLFGKYAGSEIKLDGEDHVILREDEILGVLV